MTDRREVFEVGSRPQIDIKLPAGDVQVLEGAAGRVEVELSGRGVDRFIVEQVGDIIRVAPERDRNLRFASHDLVVRAPAGSVVYGRIASADVLIDVALSELDLKTASGEVRVRDISGDATIASGSGDVVVGHVTGRLRVATASGDVRVDAVDGGADINAAAGDIIVDRSDGDLNLKSASGDVVVGNCCGDDVSCKSMSGDVRIGFPAGRTLDLDVQTLSGDLRSEFDASTAAGESTGTSYVRAKTISGDIVLERS